MRRFVVGLILATLLVHPNLAQPSPESDLYLPDTLVVAVGETLRINPGTRVHGPGHIEVRGTLIAIGTPDAPIQFHAPVALQENQSTRLAYASVERIPGAAITLLGGRLDIENAKFSHNLAGIVVSGTGNTTLTIANTTFEEHSDTALRLGRVAHATVENASLAHNAIGITVRLDAVRPTRLSIANTTFADEAAHVRIEVTAGADPESIVSIERSRFRGPSGTLVVAGTAQHPAGATPSVMLHTNLFKDTDVAVRLEGQGYGFESRNDTYSGNLVGISSADATFILIGSRFTSLDRDLDLGPAARFEAEGVSFTPASPTSTAPLTVGTSLVWPLFGGVLAIIGVAALVVAGTRSRRRPTAPTPTEESPPDARAATRTKPPANHAFSRMELRILHDIADHPDTAQSAMASRLGVSRQAAHYHVKKLVGNGFIEKTDRGRASACRIAKNVRIPPLPPTVTQQGGVEKE